MSEQSNTQEVIHLFQKNASQVVCATLDLYKERRIFHLRIYVPVADEPGEFIPTKKGVTLEVSELPKTAELIGGMQNAISLNQVVGAIVKGKSSEVRFGLQEYKGTPTVYVRIFKQDSEGEWHATQRGISLRVEKLPELVEAVRLLREAAEKRGWL